MQVCFRSCFHIHFTARPLFACPLQKDGCSLLHCEEQGPPWTCRAQEDYILFGYHQRKCYFSYNLGRKILYDEAIEPIP